MHFILYSLMYEYWIIKVFHTFQLYCSCIGVPMKVIDVDSSDIVTPLVFDLLENMRPSFTPGNNLNERAIKTIIREAIAHCMFMISYNAPLSGMA